MITMLPGRFVPSNFTLRLSFICLFIALKVGGILWLRGIPNKLEYQQHTYIGDDYPRTWPIDELSPVLMVVEDTDRYRFDTPDGAAEWAALTPESGILHLGEGRQSFSLSMFHQLRCLNIIGSEIVRIGKANGTSAANDLSRHCLNYMRQIITCRADLNLESVVGNPGRAKPGVYHCEDWEAVYEEVRRNQEDHLLWKLKV